MERNKRAKKLTIKKYKNKKNKKSPTENNDRRQWTEEKLLHFGWSLYQMLTSNSMRQNIKLQLVIFIKFDNSHEQDNILYSTHKLHVNPMLSDLY